MNKQKAPKAQADALAWLDQAIQDFGISGLAVRDLIEFLKNGLKSSNAAVRQNATKTLVTLQLFIGPSAFFRLIRYGDGRWS
jgi:cytoskeleton-associated protein 5